MKSFKEIEDNLIANTYAKRDVEIVRGSGAIVYDKNGKEYIDCVTGNGVALLGHGNKDIAKAVSEQAQKIITTPGIFYSEARANFAEKITKILPIKNSKIFLGNSGTEAVECTIKLARKATGKTDFIAMKNGFHGRTLGALSATFRPKYRKPFEPLVPGFTHVSFNNIDELRNAITERTAGVILEAVQGEAGVVLADRNYLKEVRELCDEKGVLMILDEIQTFGRTGNYFAAQTFGIEPDILTVAKGLAGGVPIGLCAARTEIFDKLEVGEHASTFGGNALACAAGTACLDVLEKEKLVQKGAKMGEKLRKNLEQLNGNEKIREVRGIGAMIAVESRFPVKEQLGFSLKNGVLAQTSGMSTIRLLPPLIINEKEVETVSKVIINSFAK
ncbi:TPA: acetylornithine/succinylornithine family transaminase [archaeon]|uniref:Acetylornithine/succinylornithine family transaminase n=1 Tax=Candidatus Naiadarchaeum limnaeum TaxID=2756139 RepID=A0A832VA51_9ARCH|nr:acetylornithine/succinylornithine family transaminase [Candidatus Naiadarchaeales archaeon SRR2090153.bin1042]HIK00376.1 acetylornithine/succinylornithine family transaminase [Candidatus Naiadarchaeum limnaeum]